jgi:hypothetical protein
VAEKFSEHLFQKSVLFDCRLVSHLVVRRNMFAKLTEGRECLSHGALLDGFTEI